MQTDTWLRDRGIAPDPAPWTLDVTLATTDIEHCHWLEIRKRLRPEDVLLSLTVGGDGDWSVTCRRYDGAYEVKWRGEGRVEVEAQALKYRRFLKWPPLAHPGDFPALVPQLEALLGIGFERHANVDGSGVDVLPGLRAGSGLRTWLAPVADTLGTAYRSEEATHREEAKKLPATVALTSDGLSVNGAPFYLPASFREIKELLGDFDRRASDATDVVRIWDGHGIVAYAQDGDNAQEVVFCFAGADLPHGPEQPFGGSITVDGHDAVAYYEARRHAGVVQLAGIRLDVRYSGADPTQPAAVSLRAVAYAPPLPDDPDRYVHRPLEEPVIAFKDFGFKLSVVQELMYGQGVLEPRFDLHGFVERYRGRAIDLEAEGYDPIEEVTQWFRDLEVPTRLSPLVTEIYQDGGNDIYHQLIRFPEGYEEYWDIETTADAAHFPNLKTATICYGKPGVVDELRARGIDADWL